MFVITFTFMNPATTAFPKGGKAIVFIGTFKGDTGKGIYAWRFDSDSGEMEPLGLVAAASRPTFLAVHPNRRFLYAVSRPSPVLEKTVSVMTAPDSS